MTDPTTLARGLSEAAIAPRLGRSQRAVILALSADEWRKAPSHAAAKRLWYRDPRLVDHKHRTDNCWRLTKAGLAVRNHLQGLSE